MKFNGNMFEQGNKFLASRRDLEPTYLPDQTLKPEAEGGCGVTGFAASVPVSVPARAAPPIHGRTAAAPIRLRRSGRMVQGRPTTASTELVVTG